MEPVTAVNFLHEFENLMLNRLILVYCVIMRSFLVSLDSAVTCNCCGEVCLKMKCSGSTNHLIPPDPSSKLRRERFRYKHFRKMDNCYFIQCVVQIVFTELKNGYIFIWNTHGHLK